MDHGNGGQTHGVLFGSFGSVSCGAACRPGPRHLRNDRRRVATLPEAEAAGSCPVLSLSWFPHVVGSLREGSRQLVFIRVPEWRCVRQLLRVR